MHVGHAGLHRPQAVGVDKAGVQAIQHRFARDAISVIQLGGHFALVTLLRFEYVGPDLRGRHSHDVGDREHLLPAAPASIRAPTAG